MMSGQFCTFAMILLLINVLLNVISEDDDDKDGKDNDIKNYDFDRHSCYRCTLENAKM